MGRQITNPWSWQEPFAFVHAHETTGAQKVLYCAGQFATDEDGRPLHAGDIRAQTNPAFDNLEKRLQAAGYSLGDVVRLNYYTTDVDGLIANWDVIGSRLSAAWTQCASTLLGAARLAFAESMIEIEATAAK
jgi:enamine deaminase RidA (YjgF/YER057c/UK114 family)